MRWFVLTFLCALLVATFAPFARAATPASAAASVAATPAAAAASRARSPAGAAAVPQARLSNRQRQQLADLVRDAELALAQQGDESVHRAAQLLQEARALAPNNAGIAYNQGVAAWRLGDAQSAQRAFRDAAELSDDPALRARSAYNLGTALHRSLVDGSAETEDLRAAEDLLEEAIESYRRALRDDDAAADARANGEMAWRLLEQLREMADQQEQQQGDQESQEDGESPPEDQSGDPSGDESDDAQGGEGDAPGESGSAGDSSESGEQDADPDRDQEAVDEGAAPPSGDTPDEPAQDAPQSAPGEEQDDPQDASGADEPEEESDDAEGADESQNGADQESSASQNPRDGMTREEAERLLQIIRDSEARRRAELRARQRAAAAQVERDW